MKPLNIRQETERERLSRLEKTLVTIYDSLPVFIKTAIDSQKVQSDSPETVKQLIEQMRSRIEFDRESSPPSSHQ